MLCCLLCFNLLLGFNADVVVFGCLVGFVFWFILVFDLGVISFGFE